MSHEDPFSTYQKALKAIASGLTVTIAVEGTHVAEEKDAVPRPEHTHRDESPDPKPVGQSGFDVYTSGPSLSLQTSFGLDLRGAEAFKKD